jgi:flavin reductase (DIM6/NTAB) family NADH-FMN oxidoreductase RutF
MPATLAELEARVAALEPERADYRTVLAAVNAIGANQREHAEGSVVWRTGWAGWSRSRTTRTRASGRSRRTSPRSKTCWCERSAAADSALQVPPEGMWFIGEGTVEIVAEPSGHRTHVPSRRSGVPRPATARPEPGDGRLTFVDARDTFNDLVGALDYPMFIVTTRDGAQLAGCLVGFGSQSSIDPPRFLVCLSHRNHTYRVARQARNLAVHLVPRQAEELAELFGGCSGDEVDKFARCVWQPGPGELPILQDCGNWFVGRILDRLDLGDHTGFLLDPVAAHRTEGNRFLPFHRARRIEPGHPA